MKSAVRRSQRFARRRWLPALLAFALLWVPGCGTLESPLPASADPPTDPPVATQPTDPPVTTGTLSAYFVSNNGSDENGGRSPDSPWQSLARLASVELQPGDHVMLERGSTFRETLNIAASGEPGDPIVYEGYGNGPRPIVSGADIVSGWSEDGSGIYVATVAIKPARVWADGVELTRGAKPTSLRAGQFVFADERLYVRLAEGTLPGDGVIEAAQRTVAIRDEDGHSYITIKGIVGEKANGTTKFDAVFNARGASDYWTIDGAAAFDGAANGFFGEESAVSGIGSHLRAINVEAARNARRGVVAAGENSRDQIFEGLYAHDNKSDGILINSSGGQLRGSHLVGNGAVDGGMHHGFYIYPWHSGGNDWQIIGNEMDGNLTSGGRIAGSNHHVAGNVVSGSPYGFFLTDNEGPNQGHIVEDNVIVNTDVNAYALELEGTIGVIVRNNRLVDAAGIGIVQGRFRNNEGLLVTDNLFGGDPTGAFVYVGSAQASGASVSGNCYDPSLTVQGAVSTLITPLGPWPQGRAVGSASGAASSALLAASSTAVPTCGESG